MAATVPLPEADPPSCRGPGEPSAVPLRAPPHERLFNKSVVVDAATANGRSALAVGALASLAVLLGAACGLRGDADPVPSAAAGSTSEVASAAAPASTPTQTAAATVTAPSVDAAATATPAATPATATAAATSTPAAPAAPADVAGDALAGRTFVATAVEGRQLVTGTELRLTFSRAALIGADAGCNSLSGAYRLEAGTLVVSDLRGTLMGCPPELQAQDDWLADVLESGPALTPASTGFVLSTEAVQITFEPTA